MANQNGGMEYALTLGVMVAGLALAFVLQDAVIAEYPDVFARLMSDVSLDDAIAALPIVPEL